MYGGEVIINQRTAKIIRTAGLLVPFLLLLYGYFIQTGLVKAVHYSGDAPFLLFMGGWIVVAVIQFLLPIRRKIEAIFYISAYHVFGALYILFISGFTTPFSVAWVVLFLAAYAYFSKRGLTLSIAALGITITADTIIYADTGTSLIFTNVLTFVAVVAAGITAIAIGRVQEIDGAELDRSKALETLQRDRILTIVNNLADAVLSTDRDGIVRVYNAASLNLLDTNASLNGHHVDDIMTIYDKGGEKVELFDELEKSHSVVVRDDLVLSLEGETLRLEATFSPIRSSYTRTKRTEENDGYIIILRDITKAKSLEEERDEFISVVSHELRTPITIAEGTISNVQVMMERPSISQAILKQGVQTAHDQVIYLSKMVNDLSTLSRAERGVADAPETITVRDLIDDLHHEYEPQARARNLHFNLDLDSHLGTIHASPLYLKELLQNFITNALKYTKEGGVTLRVSRKDNTVRFEVEDTGIGVSKSDQAKIFNKFYRSEDYRTRETSGTGLGLYVAAKLAKKLGTHIELYSRLNHGSRFSITLPIEKKSSQET
jgi:two-component system, OmpR family, phosphate regulon sensor histidine kinase PhoR